MISTVTQRLTEVGQAALVQARRAAMDKMADSIRFTLRAEIWMICLEIYSAACFTVNPDRSSPARAIGRILEVGSAELMVTARASAAQQAAAIAAGLAARPAMATLAVLTASILAAASTAALVPLKEARICVLRSASALTKRHLAAKRRSVCRDRMARYLPFRLKSRQALNPARRSVCAEKVCLEATRQVTVTCF